jgi:hypothetical protein
MKEKSKGISRKSKVSKLRFACFFLIAYSLLLTANAQSVHVSAKLDSTSMRIGEQIHLHLNAVTPPNTQVIFPVIPDTIHKLEIVQRSKTDTTKAADGKTITYHQQYTITGFDSGYFVIEPMTFQFRKESSTSFDTMSTEAMLVQVMTIPVDTTQQIKDIKPPVEVPFTFMDALPYIIGGLVLFAIIYFLIRYFKNRKKIIPEVMIKKPTRPAHEIAMEALNKIREEKLWQQGFYKQYQSAVSDTVRTYIEYRFSIQAMEYTTDETLKHFRNNMIPVEAKEKLRQLLQLADMVKFAKAIPVGSENEQAMQQAIDFIMMTKPITKDDFVPATPENKEKEVVS